MSLSVYRLIEIVKKEFAVSIRQRAIFSIMVMFSLTALASISLAIGGAVLEPELLSALLWIIIFFTSSAIDKTFDDEAIDTLKIYGDAQSILFGKMIYSFLSILLVVIFILPVFLILFDCDVKYPLILIITITLGLCGISSAGTLISAISSVASVKSGLFPILLFPIILPLFLPAIQLTSTAFSGSVISYSLIMAMILYNLILTVAASILFDNLWY
ncbi:MAG: heme exporter protein CcmB [Selenomonadaceae bacterium]|nr:heme exporter protein CcmB [Selenomonadaceae bacterium]